MNIVWRVQYEAGTITGVGYSGGSEIMRTEVKTAGEPAAIVLTPDRSVLGADGSDLSFITVTLVDSNNVTVPHADNLVNFSVEGSGSIAGVDNGLQTSMEPFKADYRKAFNGKCLVVVKAGREAGDIKVTASAEGLAGASSVLQVR
jgi:beta-galactosidase